MEPVERKSSEIKKPRLSKAERKQRRGDAAVNIPTKPMVVMESIVSRAAVDLTSEETPRPMQQAPPTKALQESEVAQPLKPNATIMTVPKKMGFDTTSDQACNPGPVAKMIRENISTQSSTQISIVDKKPTESSFVTPIIQKKTVKHKDLRISIPPTKQQGSLTTKTPLRGLQSPKP